MKEEDLNGGVRLTRQDISVDFINDADDGENCQETMNPALGTAENN
jgi:hypothetical protein